MINTASTSTKYTRSPMTYYPAFFEGALDRRLRYMKIFQPVAGRERSGELDAGCGCSRVRRRIENPPLVRGGLIFDAFTFLLIGHPEIHVVHHPRIL